MSTLRVANLHFEVTGNNRIELVNNTISISTGGVSRFSVANAGISGDAIATASNLRAGTSNKLVEASAVYSASAPVALTDATNVAVDFNAGRNFTLTLGGNRTLSNPTNQVAGQCGILIVKQDATGGRTLSYANNWKFSSGAPTLSTGANAIDVIAYYVEASGTIISTFSENFT